MRKLIVINQKAYLDLLEAKTYIMDIKDKLRTDLEIIICPSNIYLPFFKGRFSFKIGAQNISVKEITGETTAKQLKSLGVTHAIVGHGERKIYLKEENSIINHEIKEAIKYGIMPIICLGETLEEKALKKTGNIILKQIKDYLKDVDLKEDIIFAYEPIWALNSTKSANIEEITEIVELIKATIYRIYHTKVKVIYGGNVNKQNIKNLDKLNCLDGYIIGKTGKTVSEALEVINSIG